MGTIWAGNKHLDRVSRWTIGMSQSRELFWSEDVDQIIYESISLAI